MATKLERIAELVKTKPNEKLQTLVHLINSDSLKESHKRLSGRKAIGVDGITKEEYDKNLDENIQDLWREWKDKPTNPNLQGGCIYLRQIVAKWDL